jgi:hypothetical protein
MIIRDRLSKQKNSSNHLTNLSEQASTCQLDSEHWRRCWGTSPWIPSCGGAAWSSQSS